MTNLMERLREETRSLHEQTEQLLFADALRESTLAADEYNQLLLAHLAYHSALETAIDRHPEYFADYTPDDRRKTSWLQADLAQLRQTISAPSANLFENWSPAELLGAAYVGEGSMLGGKTVWHYLQNSPAVRPLLEHARFYRGYGAETGPKWKAFIAFVTKQVADESEDVVKGAQQAFLTYQSLFRRVQQQWTAELRNA
ncbi:biliverdin-producing heme oxygenase [Spirosoma fluminis]